MPVSILRGDARALPLADQTIDLVVTSPPYFGLRSYQDGGQHFAGQLGDEPTPGEYLANLLACTAEMVRVLKPTGSIWINLGDKYSSDSGGGGGSSDGYTARGPRPRSRATMAPAKSLMGLPWRYAIRCVDELGLILRAEVIWSKPNGLPESVTDRVRRSHEQWFHFTREPRYFSAVDEVREGYEPSTISRNRYAVNSHTPIEYSDTSRGVLRDSRPAGHKANPLGKLPGSVWTIPTQPLRVPPELGVDHFAAFPMEWPRRIILGWSPPDGVVLDPFGGTGTTALVADALGRHGIHLEASADYNRLAAWRTTDPTQRAIAAQRTPPVQQIDGQEALL